MSIDGVHSSMKPLHCGVPQGSVLGPLLLPSSYRSNKRNHEIPQLTMNYHMYADDTQLYFSFKSTDPDDPADSKSKVEACASDIISWMTVNHLKIKSDKSSDMHQFYPSG